MHASSARRVACKRFVAALLASTLAHMLLTSSVKPGSSRSHRSAELSSASVQSISVRLVPPHRDPLPEAAAAEREAPIPEPRLQVRAQRAPAPTAAHPRLTTATSTGPAAEMPDPTYYAARQLDVYPALLTGLDTSGSDGTAGESVNGHVLLLVLIDANGAVDTVSIVEAEPAGRFDAHAQRALENARFTPAMRNGRAVKSRVLINVSYGSPETASR